MRMNHPTVTPNEARGVVLRMSRDLELPTRTEGIRAIQTMEDFEQADLIAGAYITRQN